MRNKIKVRQRIKDSNERCKLDSCVCQLKGVGSGRGDNTRGKSLLIGMGGCGGVVACLFCLTIKKIEDTICFKGVLPKSFRV